MKQKKNIFKIVISCVLIISILAGLIALIANLFDKDDYYERIKPKFKVGGLNSTGSYFENSLSLYTEKPFSIVGGLKVTLDFDSTIQYQVYYYKDDSGTKFISKTSLSTDNTVLVIPEEAQFARIVLLPSVPEGKDKFNFIDVFKYSRQIKIEVAKEDYEENGFLLTGIEGIEKVALRPDVLVFKNNGDKAVADIVLKVTKGDVISLESFELNEKNLSIELDFYNSSGIFVTSLLSFPEGVPMEISGDYAYARISITGGSFTKSELLMFPQLLIHKKSI